MHGSQFESQERLPNAIVEAGYSNQDGRLAARKLAEETPVAFVYNGTTFAVVMATPADLTDLAFGFSLTEGIIAAPSEIEKLEIVRHGDSVELRMWLTSDRSDRLAARRRRLVGPTGCGLCGIESLADACPPIPCVTSDLSLGPEDISSALDALTAAQEINRATRATHAAGIYQPGSGLLLLREDVGRHNALDKLAGAMAAEGVKGSSSALVLTSRVSIELVQKAAVIGTGILIAVSAPTALAVRTASASRITLIGIARGREFQVFNCPERIRAKT